MNPSTKDKLTKLASFTCVLHCIIAPFIVMAAPTIGHAFENIWIELGALIASIGFGIAIIYNGYCTHKKTCQYFVWHWGFILEQQLAD